MVSTKGFTYIAVTNPEIKLENAPKDAKEVSQVLIFRVEGLNGIGQMKDQERVSLARSGVSGCMV